MPNGEWTETDVERAHTDKMIGDLEKRIEQKYQEIKAASRPARLQIGNVGLEANGDRAILLEDEFRSGYECKFCGGKGRTKCDNCGGNGVSPVNPEIVCKACEGKLIVTCPQCHGKGGILVTPDIAQRRPTTGVIQSIGPGTYQNGVWVPTHYKVGQGVMYSNFAGYAFDIDNKVVRILHEVEIFCEIFGHLEMRTVPREMPDSHDSFNASMLDRGRE